MTENHEYVFEVARVAFRLVVQTKWLEKCETGGSILAWLQSVKPGGAPESCWTE